MDLKDLNNTQLILLALLVSFITSIATGIVTVTLMDQAPPGVTQTINRVVEKTVRIVTPPDEQPTTEIITETIIIKEEDLIIEAAEKNSANVVKLGTLSQEGIRILGIGSRQEPTFTPLAGSGFVVSRDGLTLTESSMVEDANKQYALKTKDGEIRALEVLAHDTQNNIALLKILPALKEDTAAGATTTAPSLSFKPIRFADAGRIRIGQTAVALSSANGVSLQLGVISKLGVTEVSSETEDGETRTEKVLTRLYTTMNMSASYSGGAVLNTDAEVLGIAVITKDGEQFVVPSNIVQELLAVREKEMASDAPNSQGKQAQMAGAGGID